MPTRVTSPSSGPVLIGICCRPDTVLIAGDSSEGVRPWKSARPIASWGDIFCANRIPTQGWLRSLTTTSSASPTHATDFHGSRPSRAVSNGPYGVPFRSLLPKELDNLLVACRGASFSSIGASSCRLSRTMMMLGQAAGTAAALFGLDTAADVSGDGMSRLQDQLVTDGVALTLEEGYLDAMAGIELLPQILEEGASPTIVPQPR
ncbi:MAG: hypothetical protein CME05_02410 [Gemmatimonadaceae bacterium]|nr:hypothetical protein [Gemmatimonadaceae bacterium]